ncbi:hypothetical protein CR513_49364, partial [Mucuna pruriens]
RLRRIHPKPSQSDSIAFESVLSQDRVGFVYVETKSDQSLPRVSRQSRSAIWHMTKPAKSEKYELRKEFSVSQKVLLFNSRLKLIADKLRSKCDGSFVVINVFPYAVVEVRDEANDNTFKVNGHQLKSYYEGPNLNSTMGEVEIITLIESVIPKDSPDEVLESPNA